MFPRPTLSVWLAVFFCLIIVAGPLTAFDEHDSSAPELQAQHPDLEISKSYPTVAELPLGAAAEALSDLETLNVNVASARLDRRGGRWETLLPAHPLLPGEGVGNNLRWEQLGIAAPEDSEALEGLAWNAFVLYLETFQEELRINPGEIPAQARVVSHDDGRVIQIYAPRIIGGVPVRGSYLTAVISHGNLILFGAHNWGDVEIATLPALSSAAASDVVQAHAGSRLVTGAWGKTELIIVPMAFGSDAGEVAVGQGYDHRLAWVVRPAFAGDLSSWEALIDANSGEVLSFEDSNHYAEAKGGVYPVTNDGVVPDGIEQAGWPMPFDRITHSGGTAITDSGGNIPGSVSGTRTSNLAGEYVRMNDNCGAISLSSTGDLDFGTSGGDDCTTPGFGGPGNTHSSRTGFHELNRMVEMAQSQLPSNSWLQNQLTSNMNINNSCNAFWNGSTVNFYRSGGGCSNTGEIAGVFDHEWGHGMDDNDAVPTIAGPSGEGIADIYTALRLNTSCIGRNFRSTNCGGFGDPCLSCTGVRDIDYLKRASGNPHTYSWSNANCGGSVHCVGSVYSEAVWSLWKRLLQAAPYNMDNNTAHEVVNRLTFIGAGNVGTWFSGGPPNGGCGATGGYLQYLAADDDNGNLNDGTPHMNAIFTAFDDQEIACPTPTVQDAGCVGTPTSAPSVTASPLDKSVSLSWGAVGGTTEYEIFRTDGVFGCDFGKTRLGSTTATTWNDSGLQNGRDYSYVVIPKGPSNSCFGPASACDTVAPAAGPNLDIDTSSAALSFSSGDGDQFLDNCEQATMTFDVSNTGLGSLTNVRITGVTSPSHPSIVITTSFPAAVTPSTLAQGATGSGSFSFTADGLSFDETVTFQVSVTADQISPTIKSAVLEVASVESDFVNFASKTFSFESGTEDWTVIEGTFNRTSSGGGAQGTTWYEASSANLDNQCDHIRSPILSLTGASTLSLWNQFDIEPIFNGSIWYDRANVGIYEVATGDRSSVDPDGGRLYNASGSNGNCGTEGQNGWADDATTWGESTWSAAALGSPNYAGQQIQLDIRYGTDFSLNGFGFHFDQVTVTDFNQQGPDAQSDSCVVADPFKIQVGTASVTHQWLTVNLESGFSDPVVVAKPASYNGADPTTVRLRNVTPSSFEIRLQEWSYLNGTHGAEQVSFVAVERGSWQLAGGVEIEASSVNISNSLPGSDPFVPVNFGQAFSESPLVFSVVGTSAGNDAVVTRHQNVTTSGFDVIMQEQQSLGGHGQETIYWLAWKPGSGVVGVDGGALGGGQAFEASSVGGVTHTFSQINFQSSWNQAPCFLADMQTTNGADTANLRYRNLTASDVQVQVDEEQSADTETSHIAETVGYLAFDCSQGDAGLPEFGRVSATHLWQTVPISGSFSDPIVVAKPASYNGPDPTTVRLRNVSPSSFEIRLQEWNYLNGTHGAETVSYLVVERGSWLLPGGGAIEAGSVSTSNSRPGSDPFVGVSFAAPFPSTPVVLSVVGTDADADAVATRNRGVSTSGFETILQEEEAGGAHGAAETIYWIAWQAGTSSGGDPFTYEAGTQGGMTHLFTPINFSSAFNGPPCFLADMQTFAGADPATLRYNSLTSSSVNVQVDDEQSADAETNHNAAETVGWVAFECSLP